MISWSIKRSAIPALQRGKAAWYAGRVKQRGVSDGMRGSINWTALMALAATVAALAAVAIAVGIFRQMRQDGETSRFAIGVESVWHLEQMWDSPDMLDTRQGAATALLDGKPNDDVAAVLDFFDMVALLVKRNVLDREVVWHAFYWPMACYWTASQDYIASVHARDPLAWQDTKRVISELRAIEAHKGGSASRNVSPSSSDIANFLRAERGDDDDSAEANSRRTPL